MGPITIKDNNKPFKTLQLLSGYDQVHTSPCGNSYWKNPEEMFTSRGKNRWDMKTEFAGWESREKAGGSLRLTTKAAPSTLNIPRARFCASLGGWGRAEKVGSVLAPSEPIKKNLR